MKRKSLAAILALAMLFSLALYGCGQPGPSNSNAPGSSDPSGTSAAPEGNAGETYEITFAHFFPAVHPVHLRLEKWAEALSEASGGRIKIVFHYAETLLKSTETYEGVTSGIADMGLVVPSYTPGLFPMTELYDLPVSYNNCEVISKVFWDCYQEFRPEEWSNVKVLGLYAIGPGGLATKKPVESLADLKGLQIRATGTAANYMKALGAAPVSIAMPEAYEAVSRGVCDGVLNAWDAFITWKLVEVSDHFTMTPFLYTSPFFTVMNLNQWNALPADIQVIFEEVGEEFITFHSSEEAKNAITSIQSIIDSGKTITVLSEDEEAAWLAAVQPAIEQAIASRADKGPAQEFYDRMAELAQTYNGEYPSLKEAFQEMIG